MSDNRQLIDFEGLWRLEREIVHDDGQTVTFRGDATWTGSEDELMCSETGILSLAGQRMEATRKTVWRAPLDVFFDDGKFFHSVPPGGGAASHDCAPDRYDVMYNFAAWPVWTVHWRVVGPRKAYTTRSEYRR